MWFSVFFDQLWILAILSARKGGALVTRSPPSDIDSENDRFRKRSIPETSGFETERFRKRSISGNDRFPKTSDSGNDRVRYGPSFQLKFSFVMRISPDRFVLFVTSRASQPNRYIPTVTSCRCIPPLHPTVTLCRYITTVTP